MTDETPSEEARGEPAAEEPTVAAPIAAPPEPGAYGYATTPPPPRHATHFMVPKWVGLLLAGLLLAGVGFGVGWAVADHRGNDGNDDRVAARVPGGLSPGNGSSGNGFGGRMPIGGGDMPGRIGRSSGPYLGVVTQAPSDGSGAQVVRVANGSPADGAGLKADDVITKVDDTAISSPSDLVKAVTGHKVGDEVTITYTRGSDTKTLTVKLANRSDISTQ
ncbi:MAG: PDZ domain-containing protein [Acidimicrobiia bacterium]